MQFLDQDPTYSAPEHLPLRNRVRSAFVVIHADWTGGGLINARDHRGGEGPQAQGSAEHGDSSDAGQDQGGALLGARIARPRYRAGARPLRRHRRDRDRGAVPRGGVGRLRRSAEGGLRGRALEPRPYRPGRPERGPPDAGTRLPAPHGAAVRPRYPRPAVCRSCHRHDARNARRLAVGRIRARSSRSDIGRNSIRIQGLGDASADQRRCHGDSCFSIYEVARGTATPE